MFLQTTTAGKAEPELARLGEKIYSRAILLKEYTIEDVQMAFHRAVQKLPRGASFEEKANMMFGERWRKHVEPDTELGPGRES